MEQKFDVIVPMTADNLPIFQLNIKWMQKNLSCRRILVIGAEKLSEPVRALGVEFIEENTLYKPLLRRYRCHQRHRRRHGLKPKSKPGVQDTRHAWKFEYELRVPGSRSKRT